MLLDGAKSLYPDVLALLEPHLRPGALIVADNADWSPDYLLKVRAGGPYMSVPFGPDIELSIRLEEPVAGTFVIPGRAEREPGTGMRQR